MRSLSISRAWEETRGLLAQDGRLYVSVALALIALPSVINMLMSPSGVNTATDPFWKGAVAFVASLIALAGQLALIRLAVGPSTTVGAAITHGLRRTPFYVIVVILLILGLIVLSIPLAIILIAAGVPITSTGVRLTNSPVIVMVGLLYLVVAVFVGVRMILSAPIASAEDIGPIAILRRSWALTHGYWWGLFGFVAVFVVAAIIVAFAVSSALGVVLRLTVGPLEPMSGAALMNGLVQSVVSAGISTIFSLMLARIYVQLRGQTDYAETFR